MRTHDIIDNRTEKLIDHLNQILGTSGRARFAVGYLFLTGLTSVAKRLLNLKELRLLIGNTTNKETIELPADVLAYPVKQALLAQKGLIPDPGDVFGKKVYEEEIGIVEGAR